jgi:2-dehydro-3-deoxyphosphogluconate aldolase/(4S)-4-hydroxy-2-oxoglutarate aldolase
MSDTLKTILDSGLIAIMRSDSSAGLLETARALARGGVRAMEVTLTTPGALETISAVAKESRGEFLIGAGTVLDAESARQAISAGAEFLVSPSVSVEVIQTAKRHGKVVCPGALTPTEIVTAWQAGADLIKVFPAFAVGPAYIKAVLAPLPQVRLMPVGGVDLGNLAAYFKAGACAVAVGGGLINKERIEKGQWDLIAETAREYVEAVAKARGPGLPAKA